MNIVDGLELDLNAFKNWRAEYASAQFILEDGKYICGTLTEKMSKRLFNTVNPDVVVDEIRCGHLPHVRNVPRPVEQSKPWETKGIEGVHRFLKKF